MGDRSHLTRGFSSAVSPLVEELLRGDTRELTPALRAVGNHDVSTRPVPFSHYYDPAIAKLETEKLWKKTWQYACREEDLPQVGDRLPYDVGTMSFFIVRSGANEFKAFYNACLHRGTRLCDGQGSGDSVRCPFHAWEWKLDGQLKVVTSAWDFTQVKPEQFRLPEVKVATWGGFIFINPDPDAKPLEHYLGVLPEHFRSWAPEDHFTAVHIRKRVRANWKTTMEAFLEAYHVIETHSDAMPFTGDASTQYDVWDDGDGHVSRLYTPLGVPSPHLGDDASLKEATDWAFRVFAMGMGPDVPVPTFNPDAALSGRAQVAQWRRELLGGALGRDFSDTPDAYLVDTIQYHLFPNFCPWLGEGLPLVYQFTPYGDDPNSSVMDIRLLAPVPGGGAPRPPSAAIIDIDFDADFSSVPQIGVLAHIFDQDFVNLPKIQAGMRSAADSHAQTALGHYQESRIRYFHDVLEKTLGLDGA